MLNSLLVHAFFLLLVPTLLVGNDALHETTIPSNGQMRQIYVSVEGDDKNYGSSSSPFRTIQKAADEAIAGDTVIVLEGTYRETIVPKNSGTKDFPIVFKANPGDKVVISGADIISGFQASSDQIYTAKIPQAFESKINQSLQVFVNKRMMNEARFPNMDTGYDLMRQPRMIVDEVVWQKKLETIKDDIVKARICIKSKDFTESEGKWDGARISIRAMWKWGWGMPRTGTIVSSKPGELVFDIWNYVFTNQENAEAEIVRNDHPGGINSPFFVFRSEQGMDHPGEWYFNPETSELKIIPLEGDDLRNSIVEVKKRDWAFDLSEKSHIKIQGFDLFACTITTDNQSGSGIPETYGTNEVRVDTIAKSENITIDGINARYLSHFTNQDGFILSQWKNNTGIVLSGKNHVIKNSVIGYSAGNGVVIMGENHKVTNNIIFNVGYSGAETGWVASGWSIMKDFEISYNTCYAAGGNGFHFNFAGSSSEEKPISIHHNLLNECGTMRNDIGFIYTYGSRDETWGEFHHNLLYSSTTYQAFGIYHDYGGFWRNYNNIVYDVSWASCMHANDTQGLNTKYYNNLLWGIGYSARGNVEGDCPGKGVEFINNIMHGECKTKAKCSVYENNFETNQNYDLLTKLFVDPYANDFSLMGSDTEIIDKGKIINDFGTRFPGKTPDIGPVEKGEKMFQIGSKLPAVVEAPSHLNVKKNDDGTIAVRWTDNANNETCYLLERSTFIESEFIYEIQWELLATLPQNTTEFIDVAQEEPVAYRVRAPESRTSNIAFFK